MVDEYEQRIFTPEQTTPTPETTTSTPVESNDFPKATEFISQEGLEEKKELINKVLSDNKIKEGFENFLKTTNPRIKLKIKKDLLNCKTEDEVKSIIVENLPGYKIGEPENNGEDGTNPKNENIPEENGDLSTGVDNKNEEEEKANKEKLDIEKNTDLVEMQGKLNKAIDYRQKLIESHPKSNLEADTGPESDLYKKTKEQLEGKGIINQLKNQLNDKVKEEDKQKKEEIINKFVSDYVLVQVTYQAVKNNTSEYSQEEISTFYKIVKNLENSCNIPDTNLNSFSSGNVTQTRHELFNSDIGNDNLIQAKQSNLKSRDYKEMFPEMTEEEMVQVYGKFLARFNKRYLDEYNKHLNNNTLNEYRKTDECKQFIQTIENIKTSMDNKTKDLMEELCIISQIKGMYMCMGEGDSFDLNKANEIESENGILTLNGHIDGVDFTIRQNTNDPEARLQTSQKLAKLVDGNMFSVGGKDNFVDSNFILPTQSDIFKLAVESVNSDGALEDADTPAKYVQLTQERFMGRVDNMYEDTKYVHHYMKEQVKGEKIVNDTLGLIGKINPYIINNTALMENITQESNKDLYNFMKILKFNIDNSTDLEKDHFNWCISKIEEIINNYKTNKKISEIYPSEISKYLENDTWTEGTQEERIKLIFDLFNHFNENPIDKSRVGYEGSDRVPINIIINDLYTQLHDKPKQKQEEQQEQQNKEKETDVVYANLMAEYEKNESIA